MACRANKAKNFATNSAMWCETPASLLLPSSACQNHIGNYAVIGDSEMVVLAGEIPNAVEGPLGYEFLIAIWWRRLDSNQRPTDYETVALTT